MLEILESEKNKAYISSSFLPSVAELPDSSLHSHPKPCVSRVRIGENIQRATPYTLWRPLAPSARQSSWTRHAGYTEWHSLARIRPSGGVFIDLSWFLPLCLLRESPFSWEPEALSIKLSLEPCWSVTMEITLVTYKPATGPDTQEPHSDSHKDLSAPTLTSLKFISAGIFCFKMFTEFGFRMSLRVWVLRNREGATEMKFQSNEVHIWQLFPRCEL